MKTRRSVDISSRTAQLLEKLQKDQLKQLTDCNVESLFLKIQNSAVSQTSFSPVMAEVRTALEALNKVSTGLQSLLQELEKSESREVRFGMEWWQRRRAGIEEALSRDAVEGFRLYVKTLAEALIAWDFSVYPELVQQPFRFPEYKTPMEGWPAAIEALQDEDYSDPIVEKMLTALVSLTTPRSQPLLDAAARSALLILRGRIQLYDLAKPDKALRDFEQAIELAPDDELPVIALGEFYRNSGQLADAMSYFQRGVQIAPDEPNGYLNLGLCAEDESRWDEARRFFEQVANIVLQEPDPLMALSRLRAAPSGQMYLQLAEHLAKDDKDLALKAAEKALDIGIEGPSDYCDRFAYRLKGEILLALDQPKEAAAAFRASGQSFASASEPQEAFNTLERARGLAPDDPSIAWDLADVRLTISHSKRDGDERKQYLDETIALWDKTVAQHLPDSGYSWAYLTRALLADQQSAFVPVSDWVTKAECYGQAIAMVERSILMYETRDLAWALLTRYYRELTLHRNELFASARPFEDSFDDAIGSVTREERLISLANANDAAGAEAMLTGELDPQNNVWAKSVLAFIRLTTGNFVDVISLLEKPDDPDAWICETRALAHDMTGNLLKGTEDWNRVIKKSKPGEREFGYAAYKLGQYDEAIDKLSRLASNPFKTDDAERTLVLCYLVHNTFELAHDTLKRAGRSWRPEDIRRWIDLDLMSPRVTRVVSEPLVKQLRETAEEMAKRPQRALEDEIENALQTWASNEKMAWVRAGLQASLGRLALSNARFDKASDMYERLLLNSTMFPEAKLGLSKVSELLQKSGLKRPEASAAQ